MEGVYAGLTVVELADRRNQWAGKLLSDGGARIIQIEPLNGSPGRWCGPFVGDAPDPDRCLDYWWYNTGKQSVALDLERKPAQDLARALIARADVFLESTPPGSLAKLGLDYAAFSANRKLIYASLTDFGQDGPWRDFRMNDAAHLALGGQMASSGYSDPAAPPIGGQGHQAWHMGCAFVLHGITVALFERMSSAEGQYIDVSIHDACAIGTEAAVPQWMYYGETMYRQTGMHANPRRQPPLQLPTAAAPAATAIEDYDALITHCKGRSDRLAILDPPERVENIMDLTKVATATPPKSGAPERPCLRPPESDKAALYFPWLVIKNAFGTGTVNAPPSGFVAGIWARAAPHQPPANAGVAGALGVTYPIIDAEQAVLNPMGVNCIRHFSDSGPTVWGARTLAAQSSPFRYVNVRRLFCYIQTAIALDTRGYVFRPNDHNLWMTVRRNVSDFLRGQWRIGALHGRTPDEAFFVKCDEDTNPPESIREGKLVVEVGIAPVRPAEFVIFRVAHIESGTSNEEVARG